MKPQGRGAWKGKHVLRLPDAAGPETPLTTRTSRADVSPFARPERVPALAIMKAWLAPAVMILSTLLAPPVAWADVPPIETEGCVSRKAGDGCTDAVTGAGGTCHEDTCTSTKPDGTSSSYTCLKCVPGGDSGCSVASSTSFRRAGPWALAGLFSLLFLFVRRQKR